MRTFRDWFVSFGITVFLGLFFINSVFSQTDGEKKQWLSYFDDSYVGGSSFYVNHYSF